MRLLDNRKRKCLISLLGVVNPFLVFYTSHYSLEPYNLKQIIEEWFLYFLDFLGKSVKVTHICMYVLKILQLHPNFTEMYRNSGFYLCNCPSVIRKINLDFKSFSVSFRRLKFFCKVAPEKISH